MSYLNKWRQGFTLIELMVAVTIIAVISAIGIVSYTSANKGARDGRRMADISQVKAALELYRTDYGYYPKTSTWPDLMTALTGYITPANVEDPKPAIYAYSYTTPGGLGKTYELCAYLEKGVGTASCTGTCGSGIVCNYKVMSP